MNTLLRLFFIRHGETEWSITGRHTGRTDLPLTPHGEELAGRLTARLGSIPFAQVLTSPRLRARRTCELAGLKETAQIEPDLAEWGYGDYEGLRTAEIQQQYPGSSAYCVRYGRNQPGGSRTCAEFRSGCSGQQSGKAKRVLAGKAVEVVVDKRPVERRIEADENRRVQIINWTRMTTARLSR